MSLGMYPPTSSATIGSGGHQKDQSEEVGHMTLSCDHLALSWELLTSILYTPVMPL